MGLPRFPPPLPLGNIKHLCSLRNVTVCPIFSSPLECQLQGTFLSSSSYSGQHLKVWHIRAWNQYLSCECMNFLFKIFFPKIRGGNIYKPFVMPLSNWVVIFSARNRHTSFGDKRGCWWCCYGLKMLWNIAYTLIKLSFISRYCLICLWHIFKSLNIAAGPVPVDTTVWDTFCCCCC